MRLFFAAILIGTVVSGCKQCFKTTTDDIHSGNNWMSFHQLYVFQAPDHHNLYLIRRIPYVFIDRAPQKGSSLGSGKPTLFLWTNCAHLPPGGIIGHARSYPWRRAP
jgi:hypothetical protein